MQHFFEETALPDASNLSFPTTKPGTAKFRRPTPPACRNRRREVLGRFMDNSCLRWTEMLPKRMHPAGHGASRILEERTSRADLILLQASAGGAAKVPEGR